jgi:hypothetical protein
MAPLQIPKNLKFEPIFPISSLEMKVVHYLVANMLLAHLRTYHPIFFYLIPFNVKVYPNKFHKRNKKNVMA